MPALRPVPPDLFKRVLETRGWEVIAEDEHNWILAKSVDDFPIAIPKAVRLLAVDVMAHLMTEAVIPDGECLELLRSLGYVYPPDPFPVELDEESQPS